MSKRVIVNSIERCLLALTMGMAFASVSKNSTGFASPAKPVQGNYQKRIFQAFDIPDYQVDQALSDKMREEIELLKRLEAQTKGQPIRRADILFRMADLHWLHARSAYFKAMEDYEKQYDLYLKKQRKTKPVEPRFSGDTSFKLYQEIIRSVTQAKANYERLDEVLFLAGFHAMELSSQDAERYFLTLTKRFPNSRFLPDAYMELGNYYMDQRQFDKAIAYYKKASDSSNKLKNFALYKIAWCFYNKSDITGAMKIMQNVVRTSKGQEKELELRGEALKDLIIFYSDLGLIDEARKYFTGIGEPQYARVVMEKLAAIYFDQARYDKAINALTKLIALDPYHPDIPKHHSKIIESYEKSEQEQRSMREMQAFVGRYKPTTAWHTRNIQNAEATTYAFNRSEVYGRFLAKRHHELAQKSKNNPTQAKNYTNLSLQFYKLYLDMFAAHANAYEMRFLYADLLFNNDRFLEAADQYDAVVNTKQQGNRHKTALIGLLDALARVEEAAYAKLVDSLKNRDEAKFQRTQLSPYADRLVKADNLYIRLFPNDERTPKVYFQRAQILYNYNNFDRARDGFFEVIKRYPNDSVANASRHLILDIFNVQKDWVNLEKWATTFLGVASFATPENRTLMLELIQGSIFQRAKDLEANKKHIEAAELYERLVKQYPQSKFADKALFNAATNYINGSESDRAMATAQTFLKQHPKSPLVPQMMLTLATHFDDKLDYENAATHYEILANLDTKEDVASAALFNAGLYREHLKQYPQAMQNYNAFLKRFPKLKDAADTYFSLGVVYEHLKNYSKAIEIFTEFPRKYSQNSQRVVEAHYRRGKLLASMRRQDDATKAYHSAVAVSRRTKAGNAFSAQAMFELIDPRLKEFKAIQLRMPQRALTAALEKKAKLLTQLRDEYLKVIDLGDADMGIAALYHIGYIYQEFSLALFNAPIPKELNVEQQQLYQQELQNQAMPIEQKAIEAFEKTLAKAYELHVYTQWTLKAYDSLTQYKPDQYPQRRGEQVVVWTATEPLAPYRKGAGPLTKDMKMDSDRSKFFTPEETGANSPEALQRILQRQNVSITTNPRNFAAYVTLGRGYLQAGELGKAYQAFENASLVRPNDPQVLWNMGYIALRNKQASTKRHFEDLLRQDSNNWIIVNALAVASRVLGQEKSTIKLIRDALTANKNNLYAINNLGLLYQQTKRYELAELTFQRAKKINVNHAETYNNLGLTYLALGLSSNAITEFQQAAKLDARYIDPLLNLATLYNQHANFSQAINFYQRVLRIDPLNIPANLNIGVAYLSSNKPEEAKQAFKNALTIDSNSPEALLNLGIVYHQHLRDPDPALSYYSRFVELMRRSIPDSHPVYGYIKQVKAMPKKKVEPDTSVKEPTKKE